MKVCYVDESGNNAQDPCLVMVGIVVDAHRLYRTRDEFAEIFSVVQELFDENLRELKGAKMIFGRNRWRKVDPAIRKRIAEFFCNWLVRRKHHITLTAIGRSQCRAIDGSAVPEISKFPWLAGSLHIALQLQRHLQNKKNNKGRTFLFIDENKKTADKMAELLFDPPGWSDAYYGRKKKQDQLDQLVDSAFAVKSHHAGFELPPFGRARGFS